MKLKTLLFILIAILLVTMVANAMPVWINGFFTREILNQPPEYTVSNIQMPRWWPP